MQISMQLSYAGGFREGADSVAELEKAGLDLVWVAEAYGFDGVSLMGYIAARTETVQIGSGILPIYSRTPTLLAMTAAGVDALSGGRCILGLGASGPQVIEGFHGVQYDAPIGRTKEIIEICRQVWRRERVEHDGRYYKVPLPPDQGTGLGKPLKLINHPLRADIPIYIAALGPKNVELAFEIADGWIPIFFSPEHARDAFAFDARNGFDISPSAPVVVTDDVEAGRDFVRPILGLYIGGMGARGKNFYNALVRRYGYEAEAEKIQQLYLDGKQREAIAAVPDALVDDVALVGPRERIADRLEAWRESGATTLLCSTHDVNALRTMAELVL